MPSLEMNVTLLFCKHIVFSGIKAIRYCGVYPLGMTPLQKSYLCYKSKNKWLWDKTTIAHLVLFVQGLNSAFGLVRFQHKGIPHEIL